jgi:hypothetical protein
MASSYVWDEMGWDGLCLYFIYIYIWEKVHGKWAENFEYGATTTIIIIVGREKIYHDLIMCIFIKIKSIY